MVSDPDTEERRKVPWKSKSKQGKALPQGASPMLQRPCSSDSQPRNDSPLPDEHGEWQPDGASGDIETDEYVDELGKGQSNVLVAVRCRPLQPREVREGVKHAVRIIDGKVVILIDPSQGQIDQHGQPVLDALRQNRSKEKRYAFDHVFDETTPQRTVYNNTTNFLISGVLQGFNATVFAYGATGAGKTFTMLGSYKEPGIMYMTLQDLFSQMDSQTDERGFEVKCSFLEIYNENIRDLLQPSSDYLDVREDPVKGITVAGISEFSADSAAEVMDLLLAGNRNRTQEPTDANQTSSRSHAVLQVTVQEKEKGQGVQAKFHVGKLSMIDLAGSERASQTNNRGIRMIEGANINRSLLALGNVINALADRSKHGKGTFIPYRDSKLTRLLKDSLGGNCRTVMIANISPSHIQFEDTHNTLKYANRAKNIKTKVTRNVLKVDFHVAKYQKIIEELRTEITELKAKLSSQRENPHSFALDGPIGAGAHDERMEQVESEMWRQEIMQHFEEKLQLKRNLIDLDRLLTENKIEKSRAQVAISRWEAKRDGAGDETPKEIKQITDRMRHVNQNLASNQQKKAEVEDRLRQNYAQLQKLQNELPRRVKNDDMRAFLQLLFRAHVVELGNIELQEINNMNASVLEQRDLEIENLRLQIRLRDNMIKEREALLSSEQLQKLEASKPPSYLPCKTTAEWTTGVPSPRTRKRPSPRGLVSQAPGNREAKTTMERNPSEAYLNSELKEVPVPDPRKIKGLQRIASHSKLAHSEPPGARRQPPVQQQQQQQQHDESTASVSVEDDRTTRGPVRRQTDQSVCSGDERSITPSPAPLRDVHADRCGRPRPYPLSVSDRPTNAGLLSSPHSSPRPRIAFDGSPERFRRRPPAAPGSNQQRLQQPNGVGSRNVSRQQSGAQSRTHSNDSLGDRGGGGHRALSQPPVGRDQRANRNKPMQKAYLPYLRPNQQQGQLANANGLGSKQPRRRNSRDRMKVERVYTGRVAQSPQPMEPLPLTPPNPRQQPLAPRRQVSGRNEPTSKRETPTPHERGVGRPPNLPPLSTADIYLR
ncbi:unnamed protein product [Vitrella brassicaformis CCMP3155]|uniref:Kinesin-like protein KIN-8B n=3 Tax=Vitrella brassicaformis TaxID=1169539 RepID=A0A0G4GVT2_VITBC|nr:unnamed protein product [Vitrella brassicaformis CCMP3155]|eukprot:CEM35074.1 unnamed protein product [Vitrella brassicaformis CCMP3155]